MVCAGGDVLAFFSFGCPGHTDTDPQDKKPTPYSVLEDELVVVAE